MKGKAKKHAKKSKKIWVKKAQSKETMAKGEGLVPPKDPAHLDSSNSSVGENKDLPNGSTMVIVEALSPSKN